MTPPTALPELPAYAVLSARAVDLRSTSIANLFNADPARATEFMLQAAGLTLDYSKHLVDTDTLGDLVCLAEQAALPARIQDLFDGHHVNNTEDRPALHTLLRASGDSGHGELFADVVAARKRMCSLANSIHSGSHSGYTGKAISDVVNIGIGGSDLGPRLVTDALRPFHGSVRCHYVANVDPADLQDTLSRLEPATTVFIICSKSFNTEETLANGRAARDWMLQSGAGQADLAKHFLAVTTKVSAAVSFGIAEENCLPMWDWVGGRYSVWSAVGLSSAIAVGWENFSRFLGGAEAMDQHFRQTELSDNMPLLMSLLEVWYCNFLGAENHVVLPYDHSLKLLPDFLQQLTMESNGKQVSRHGEALDYPTAPVLWGAAGTNGQHSFHQLLHQGQLLCPADFILPLTTHTDQPQQHRKLVANCLAQSRAMMVGRSLEDAKRSLLLRGGEEHAADALAPHLAMPGNRPNTVITMESLDPATLGALLALYEHRTFCSGQLWGVNPFDQWGVELGKQIGSTILERLEGDSREEMDPATERLIAAWNRAQD